jgi:glycosyltransferase involved in cell wall biosynthesis
MASTHLRLMTQTTEQHEPLRMEPPRGRVEKKAEVLYLAPGDVGKGRVEPISWMQTCAAYADRRFDVTLVTLHMERPDAIPRADVWEHYGLEPAFEIVVAPTMLRHNSPVWWFRFWALLVSSWFAIRTLARTAVSPKPVLVHVRQPIHAVPFVLLRRLIPRSRRPRLVLETHALPKSAHRWVIRSVDVVVTNSMKLARDIRHRFRLPARQVIHSPLGPYNRVRPQPKDDARTTLELDQSKRIAAYVGKLTEELTEFLLQTAAIVTPRVDGFQLLIVGGNPEILTWATQRREELRLGRSVILTGFVQPAKIELYQAAADVLLFHVPKSFGTFEYCTPSKGYEYQAAKRPIVATDIPLFQEQFGEDGERAIRVREHTPQAFAEGILKALALEDGGAAMTERASAWVAERTWQARVDEILAAVQIQDEPHRA